jgi:hypothetical protein
MKGCTGIQGEFMVYSPDQATSEFLFQLLLRKSTINIQHV